MVNFLSFTTSNVFSFSLVLIRISGLCVVSPFYGGAQVPAKVRAMIALFVALVVFPNVADMVIMLPSNPWQYLFIVTRELCLGMMIGFLVTAVFFGFEMGGKFVSIHMGLSMARMLDPFSNKQTAVIGQLLGLMTLVLFLVINGHHFILRAIVDSFYKIPINTAIFTNNILQQAVNVFNIVIATSLKVSLPMMTALFCINLTFGFVARLVPKMNVFVLSIPAKIGLGIFITSLTFPAIFQLFIVTMESVFNAIYKIMDMF